MTARKILISVLLSGSLVLCGVGLVLRVHSLGLRGSGVAGGIGRVTLCALRALLCIGGLCLGDGGLIALKIGVVTCVSRIGAGTGSGSLRPLRIACAGIRPCAFAVRFGRFDLIFRRLGVAGGNRRACTLAGEIRMVIDVDFFALDLRLFGAGE